MASDLAGTYQRYLDVLNDRRLADLEEFVHDEVVHNDRAWTRADYAAMIADDVRRIPDVRWEAELLVAAGDLVAARLWFDCTPARPFAGIEPTGERARFAEHVLYRFRDGRIAQVWSLVDTAAVRAQLHPEVPQG